MFVAWVLMLLACNPYTSVELPTAPAHDLDREGWLHVTGDTDPYLCRDPDSGQLATCPWDRPPDALLSCDASGCHGDYDFGQNDPDYDRHLHGAAGPSCYACHDQVWSDKKVR